MMIKNNFPKGFEFLAKTNDSTKFMWKSYLQMKTVKRWIDCSFYSVGRCTGVVTLREVRLKEKELIRVIKKAIKSKSIPFEKNSIKYFSGKKEVHQGDFEKEDEWISQTEFFKRAKVDEIVETKTKQTYLISGKWKKKPGWKPEKFKK